MLCFAIYLQATQWDFVQLRDNFIKFVKESAVAGSDFYNEIIKEFSRFYVTFSAISSFFPSSLKTVKFDEI